jgi:hypothetical protein
MTLSRKPARREPTQSTYRPDMSAAKAVMRRVDGSAKASVPVPHAPRKPAKTAAERAHLGRVAALGCLLCQAPAEVHHIREGQGMAQRASHWLTVPLCPEHHRGSDGLHGLGERGFERRHRLGELDLLAQTIERLFSAASAAGV